MRLGEGQFRMANLGFVKKLMIPVPSLKEQHEIVSSLAETEAVAEGNSKLIRTFNQKIQDGISKVWGD